MRVAEAHAILSALRGEDIAGACDITRHVEGESRVDQAAGDAPGWGGLRARVDARRPVVVGHSLGGSAAVRLPSSRCALI